MIAAYKTLGDLIVGHLNSLPLSQAFTAVRKNRLVLEQETDTSIHVEVYPFQRTAIPDTRNDEWLRVYTMVIELAKKVMSDDVAAALIEVDGLIKLADEIEDRIVKTPVIGQFHLESLDIDGSMAPYSTEQMVRHQFLSGLFCNYAEVG